jgi:hypothetical protein
MVALSAAIAVAGLIAAFAGDPVGGALDALAGAVLVVTWIYLARVESAHYRARRAAHVRHHGRFRHGQPL